jgi:hypothetical protein
MAVQGRHGGLPLQPANSRAQANASSHEAQSSKLLSLTPDSQLLTPDFRLLAPHPCKE